MDERVLLVEDDSSMSGLTALSSADQKDRTLGLPLRYLRQPPDVRFKPHK